MNLIENDIFSILRAICSIWTAIFHDKKFVLISDFRDRFYFKTKRKNRSPLYYLQLKGLRLPDVFFIMSGFLSTLSLEIEFKSKRFYESYWKFVLRRFFRMMPMYYLRLIYSDLS